MNFNYSQIFEKYREYDYLNKDKMNPLIKILVSYIKPSFLLKTDILTPIHLGRAVENEGSKDGVRSLDDLNWLHSNCVGDNDFEGNISSVNRRVGFLTGTYWAWKNYERLGNPEYFGSFGCRRQLNPDFLPFLEDYDCIIPYRVDFSKSGATIKEHIIKLQGVNLFNAIINVISKIFPNEIQNFKNYLNLSSAYMYEIYVLKKDIFFEFCSWIFPLMNEFLTIPAENLVYTKGDSLEAEYLKETKEIRDVAYGMEIFTGFFCYKLSQNKCLRVKYESIIHQNNVAQSKIRNLTILSLLRSKLK